MTKLKKIIFLMCLILLASCVNVFANDIENETCTVVIGSDIENTPALNVLKTALEALNNQDAETFFNCLYTTDDIYASAEDIRKMWNETNEIVYFEVLEEKYRDDNMAAYLCFDIADDGVAGIYTEIIKRVNGEWKKVAIPHEVMANPYYESIVLERNENTVEHDFSTYTQHPSKTFKVAAERKRSPYFPEFAPQNGDTVELVDEGTNPLGFGGTTIQIILDDRQNTINLKASSVSHDNQDYYIELWEIDVDNMTSAGENVLFGYGPIQLSDFKIIGLTPNKKYHMRISSTSVSGNFSGTLTASYTEVK